MDKNQGQKNSVADKAKQLQEKVQPHFTVGKGLAVLGVGVVLYSLGGVEPAKQVSDQKAGQTVSGTQVVDSLKAKTGQAKDSIGLPQAAQKAASPSGLASPKQTAKIIDGQKPQVSKPQTQNPQAQNPQDKVGSVAGNSIVATEKKQVVSPKLDKAKKPQKPQKTVGTATNVLAETKNDQGSVLQELKKWAAQPELKQFGKTKSHDAGEQDGIGNHSTAIIDGKQATNDDEGELTAEPKIADAPTEFSPGDNAGSTTGVKAAAKADKGVKASGKLPEEKVVTGLADTNEESAAQGNTKKKLPTGLLSVPLPKEVEKQLVTAIEKKAKKRKSTGLLSAPLASEKAEAGVTKTVSKDAPKLKNGKPKNAKPENLGKAALAKGKQTMSKAAALASTVKAGSTNDTVSKSKVSEFTLANGMEVVVIPDHRAPVVTHMVWYKMGAADEEPGVSGVAHFLEHLMFKGTDKIKSGEFSKIIARNGGQDNAFTSQDAVAYHQRVAKDRLRLVMEMEANRMRNLKLTEKDIETERDVILEERRSRTDNDPRAQFREQMDSALYMNHPYGIPVIGWYDEMKKLSREDAMKFYSRYYAPNNAILVVAGDVTHEEVKKLATEIYGVIKPVEGVARSVRPQEPPHRAARRIAMYDKRVAKATWQRSYLAAGYNDAEPGEAEALDLLLKIMASGTTGRIYKSLVIKDKIASSAGGGYSGSSLDSGKISFYAIGTKGVPLAKLEEEIDKQIALIKEKGVTQQELDRARNSYTADYVYANDNQVSLARRYGWAKVVGRTIAQVEGWPAMLGKVSVADIQKVAKKYLVIEKSVTGELLPEKKMASKK